MMHGDYARALHEHVATDSDDTLAAAYELGRAALVDQLTLLDLVAMHHQALQDLEPEQYELAVEFFAHAVAPFEMALRGFREVNARLRELNGELAEQNEQLQHAKAEAEDATAELRAFSYSVSHDLRAPLNIIGGFARILADTEADNLTDRGKQQLDRIQHGVERMNGLIDDLLRLSGITNAPLRRRQVDLSEIADEVVKELRTANPDRSVAVTVHDTPPAFADRSLMRVVLTNLLGNAWKFTARTEDAAVEFGAIDGDDDETVYFVRDNGAGFDASYADRLFGTFQRLHSRDEFEGNGIGLATVRRIVARHGGRAWAEGEVGEGATFYFVPGGPADATGTTTQARTS